jgi:hypothetical protein
MVRPRPALTRAAVDFDVVDEIIGSHWVNEELGMKNEE